jgi:hypothetical protein
VLPPAWGAARDGAPNPDDCRRFAAKLLLGVAVPEPPWPNRCQPCTPAWLAGFERAACGAICPAPFVLLKERLAPSATGPCRLAPEPACPPKLRALLALFRAKDPLFAAALCVPAKCVGIEPARGMELAAGPRLEAERLALVGATGIRPATNELLCSIADVTP